MRDQAEKHLDLAGCPHDLVDVQIVNLGGLFNETRKVRFGFRMDAISLGHYVGH